MLKQGIRKIKLTENINKSQFKNINVIDPNYNNNYELNNINNKQKSKIINERKSSINRSNQLLQSKSSQSSYGSTSLKRNLPLSNVNNKNMSQKNPWNYNQNKQQLQIQQKNQMDDSFKYNKQKLQQQLEEKQQLPYVKQQNYSPSKQSSSLNYGIFEMKDKKLEYFHQQHISSQDKIIMDQSININNKGLNNSKIQKQTIKNIVQNDKNTQSKENIHEGIKKETSLLPSILQSEYRQNNIILTKEQKNNNYYQEQSSSKVNINSFQPTNNQIDLDSQKENNHLLIKSNNDFIYNQNKFVNKNNTLSYHTKNNFSSMSSNNNNSNNNNNNNNNNMSISNNKLKENEDKIQKQRESTKSKPPLITNNNNNLKDILSERFDKISEQYKEANQNIVNSPSNNNSNSNYQNEINPLKLSNKQIEPINKKEELQSKTTDQRNDHHNSFKQIVEQSNLADEYYSSKTDKSKDQVLERKQSFQSKLKNDNQSNPLTSYFKNHFDFSKYNFEFNKRSAAGLNNIGNTCFMNSALQCVFNTPVFNEFFFSNAYEKDINSKNKGVSQSYAAILKIIRSTSASSSSSAPYALKKSIERVSSQFYGTDQQDAQELLRTVLDGLHEDLNRVRTKPKYRELEADINKRSLQEISDDWYNYYKGRDDSLVTDFFSGQLLSKVICSKCQNKSLAFDNFMDLSLSFSKGQENESELVDLLHNFLKEETLDDDYYCSKCKARTKSRRSFELFKLPQILVIHLKRFNFGRYNRNKISSNVSFPVNNFDLSTFISTSNDPTVKNSKYELFGIVNHSGSLSGGHYTSESLSPYDGKWYNFNDSHASQISKEQINRYSTSGRSSPYLLFYCKSELLIPYQNNVNLTQSKIKSSL